MCKWYFLGGGQWGFPTWHQQCMQKPIQANTEDDLFKFCPTCGAEIEWVEHPTQPELDDSLKFVKKEQTVTRNEFSYRVLREQLNALTDERLDMTVTIYDRDVDEFFGLTKLAFVNEADEDGEGSGVLDDTHPYLILD